MVEFGIQPIDFCDVAYLVDGERRAWAYTDPDFGDLWASHAWDEEDYRLAVREPNVRGYTIMEGKAPVGALLFEPQKERIFVTKLFVHIWFRRNGFGRNTLGWLFDWLQRSRNPDRPIETIVPEEDEISCLFYAAMGFQAALMRGFYGRNGDGIGFRHDASH